MKYVVDTNTISLILRAAPLVSEYFARAAAPEHLILGCPVVWYEVRRGLLIKDAKMQMEAFEELFSSFLWDNYTREDWVLAATLWAPRPGPTD